MKGRRLGIIGKELSIPSRIFEKHPNELCSHLLEKASKGGGFFGPDKLQNHSSDGKGKEKKAERGGRKKEKRKKQCLHS